MDPLVLRWPGWGQSLVSLEVHLLSRRRQLLVSRIVGEEFEPCAVRLPRDSGVGGVAPLGVGSSRVFLFFLMGCRPCRSTAILVLEVLFFGALVLDVVFADVSIVVVMVVDVLVAKVVEARVLWRPSSGVHSSTGYGGFKQIRFFVTATWRSWHVVPTGVWGGGQVPTVHGWGISTVPLAARRRFAASFPQGHMGVESPKVLASLL